MLSRIETNRAVIRHRSRDLQAHLRRPMTWLGIGFGIWKAGSRLRSKLRTAQMLTRLTKPSRLGLIAGATGAFYAVREFLQIQRELAGHMRTSETEYHEATTAGLPPPSESS
jgi:hypothetical protein